MKILQVSLLLFLSSITVLSAQNEVLGYVKYKNAAQTPMSSITGNTTVILYHGTPPTIAYQLNTDNTGFYKIFNIVPGTYTLTATSNKAWGGGNSVDALLVLHNFVLNPNFFLTGLNLISGDVNGTGGTPNAADALAISRRFIGAIPNFQYPNVNPGGPDWYADSFTIIVNATSVIVQNINMLCAGDVNGSYIPPP